MSNQLNPYSNNLDIETIQTIDQLNLPIIQKHHIRLLAHCLEIFKEISKDDISLFNDDILREWCEKQSQKFNDNNFSELFYKQMSSAAEKLNVFSQRQGKILKDLELEDLIILVTQNSENKY